MFSFIYKQLRTNKSSSSKQQKMYLQTTHNFWYKTKVPYKKRPQKQLNHYNFYIIIYNKSHKFNTHERPHEQSSRIKPPSTLPVFLITGAAKRAA